MSLGTPRETWHGSDATWRGGHDEMRSDGLRKGRNGDTGYAARDMARRVKWADPALRREREGERVREREKERTRARGHARARREREREHARVGDARARKERERKNESREHSREGAREAGEGERTRVQEHTRERARMSQRGTENGAGTTTAAMGASSQQRQQWGLRGRGLERRRDTAGPARIDTVEVPARLWSAEGRRRRAPTSAGTDHRGTGQAVGEGRWDAGVHGQDCILDGERKKFMST